MNAIHETDAPAFPSTPTDRSGQIAGCEMGISKGEYAAIHIMAALVAGEPWASFTTDDPTSGHTSKNTCAAAAEAALNLAYAFIEAGNSHQARAAIAKARGL